MADPWSTVPELRLNLCVYILCMVGGLAGNITVMVIMLRSGVIRVFRVMLRCSGRRLAGSSTLRHGKQTSFFSRYL